jgi:hypothetical protein
MIKSLIGAAIGSRIAKKPARGGAVGAAMGSIAPFVITRISLPALALIGVGGYIAKRRIDKKKDERGAEESASGEATNKSTGSVKAPPPGNVVNGTGVADAPIAAT